MKNFTFRLITMEGHIDEIVTVQADTFFQALQEVMYHCQVYSWSDWERYIMANKLDLELLDVKNV